MNFRTLIITTAVLLAGTGALAEGPESGFYIGGGGQVQIMNGTGTWDGLDFSMDAPLDSTASTVGFAWTDKMLLGIKPLVGWRISPSFALQAGYTLNISKSSNQSNATTNLGASYEQGFNAEWEQRNTEILGIYRPNPDLKYYFFGGVDLVDIDMSVTLYEGFNAIDPGGNVDSNYEYYKEADDISAVGVILGAGWEFASSRNTSTYLTIQYSTAKTDDTFFGTDDFKVGVGGLSFLLGINWYPFNGGDDTPPAKTE